MILLNKLVLNPKRWKYLTIFVFVCLTFYPIPWEIKGSDKPSLIGMLKELPNVVRYGAHGPYERFPVTQEIMDRIIAIGFILLLIFIYLAVSALIAWFIAMISETIITLRVSSQKRE